MKKVKKTKHERNEKMKPVRKKMKNLKLAMKKSKIPEQDATERRRPEEKISRALQEWQTTFDATNDAIWILDKDQRILRSNKTAERIFQRSNKELIGKHCWEIVHGTKQPIPACPVLRAKKSLHRQSMDLQIGKGWFEVIVDPILDASGRYDGAVHIVSEITERKRAEAVMRESEEKFRAIADLSPASIAIQRNDEHAEQFLYVNGAWETMTGYPRDEAMLLKPNNIIHPDMRGLVAERAAARMRGEDVSSRYEIKIITKSGEVKWWDFAASVIRYQSVPAILTMALDITERKQAEKELQWKTAFLEAQVNSSFDGILIVDNHGKKILQNQRCIDLWKIPQNVVELNDDAVQVQYVMNRTKYPEQFVEKVTHLYAHPLEISHDEIEFNDGMFLDRYSAPVLGQDGTNYGRIWTFHDITDRKMAEETILKERSLLRTLIDNLPVGVFVKDTNYRKTIVNPLHSKEIMGHLKYLGVNSEIDILGKTDFQVFPKELAQKFFEEDQNVIRNGSLVLNEEGLGYSEEGNELCLLVSKIPLRNNNGEIIGMVGVANDITERKLAEQALQESKEKYYNLYRNASLGIFHSTLDGKFVDMNPALARMLGYNSPEEAVGSITNIAEQIYVESPKYDDVASTVLKSGGEIHTENLYRRRDGSNWYGMLNMRIVDDQKKNFRYYEGFVEDITERKRAEELVRKHKKQLEEAQQIARIGSWDWDAATNNTECSDELYRIFELNKSVSKFTIEKFLSAPYPDDRKMVEGVVMASLESHQPTDFEFRVQMMNGKIRWVHAKSTVSLDEHGKLDHVFGTAQDITNRKYTEEELKKSQKIYRSIFENTGNATMIVDENTAILLANSECLAATGYSPENLVGTSWTKYVAPDDLEMMNRNNQLRIQDSANAPNRYDVHLVNARGEIRNTTLTIGLIPELHQFVVSMLDITDHIRAEEALQESELRFRSLYENATIGLYRTAPDGTILLANPTLGKMLGFTSFQELAERNLEKDGFELTYQRKEFLEKIERDGMVNGLESKWICHDGKVIVVRESARAIRDSQGKTLYYDGTVEDITERKHMEEGLRNVQKLEGLGTLAGGIAHDFNNILGIILAYNSNIKKFKDDPKNLDLATETITKAVVRGKTLVQQILTFARKTEISFGVVNVNDVAMEIVTMIYEMFPKTVICSQNFDKSLPYINADRSQLHQVLLNLCINARDAMAKGGVLTLKTRMVSEANVRSRHPDADAASYVCLEVSDTGEGMAEETRKRIFEPFFTTKGIGKGTGLGLAVAFGIVQTHKGFIDVESILGTGTTFQIYLPVTDVIKPMNEKEEELLEEIQGGTEALLVVEDEEMLAIPLQMALVDKGYKVLIAGDGFTALKIYQEKKNEIALVLTDLGLPTLSGLEVCIKIKQINPKERVILATGFLDPEVKAKFLKAGVEHFLYKPYDLTKVLKEIRIVLDGK